MHLPMTKDETFLRELGDGLVLRRATMEDTDALVDFNARIHSEEGPDLLNEMAAEWTRDLMIRPHPAFHFSDFTIVEDAHTQKIVSSMNLFSQTWTYAGIPFGVGQPELVGTLPDYRNRGLVRAQFDVVHQWSKERGQMMQVISGVPYFYRQFGYEMALSMYGGRTGYLPQIPVLKDGEQEPYSLRPALEEDLPFIMQLYQQACQRSLVSCVRDEAAWLFELNGKSSRNISRAELRVIESKDGEKVGLLAHSIYRWGPAMGAFFYEIKPGISWLAVTPSVIRYLKAAGETLKPEVGNEEFGAFAFSMGTEHPVYQVLPDRLVREWKPYAWYLRVPDLTGFLHHIAPALEKRLAESPLVGHTGELKITFYRDGLRLVFEKGGLSKVESWKPVPVGHAGDTAFPGLSFLQLLFGYRSLDELKATFPDCWWETNDARALLDILFPKRYSNVWPVI